MEGVYLILNVKFDVFVANLAEKIVIFKILKICDYNCKFWFPHRCAVVLLSNETIFGSTLEKILDKNNQEKT